MEHPMLNITVPVKYSVLARLMKQAEAEDILVESLIGTVLEDHVEEPDMMSTHAALDTALQRARDKKAGAEFSLEDLFSEEEWARVPGTRGLGRRFRTAVEAGDAPIARHVRKTVTNKAVYERC
jgi:hypothetical protein